MATEGLLLRSHTGVFRRFEVLQIPADVAAWVERSRLPPTPRLKITEGEVAYIRRLRDALFRVATACRAMVPS